MLEWLWGLQAPRIGYPGVYATTRGIAHAAASGKEALTRTREHEARLADLERQIARLTLSGMAMWSLLREKHGFTEAELLAKIEAIDLSDGKSDGRVRKTKAKRCSACKRTVSEIHSVCIYCGSEELDSPAAQT